ncbi:MAG: carbohydrate ABC transporter substrate-binding protein [Chloroflexi bacterium]|nr:carbohydrate ABC transporter substrate-binding protein [Chloroflexota bacterium]
MRAVRSILLLAALLSACAPGSRTTDPSPSTTEPALSTAVASTLPVPPGTPRALTIWVPPDLSPDGSGEAAILFAARLQAFDQAHPGVRVQVRIKGRSGPAGMTEALAAAYQAAPSVLPDLAALDASELASATAAERITFWDDASSVPESWALADAILASSRAGGGVAGLPFAAEADLFAYRATAYTEAPRTWTDLLTGSTAFLFPLGDPTARFTLGQYLAAGGRIRDADGAPTLDRLALQEVLSFYVAARAGGLLPLTSRQHESSDTTGEALLSGKIDAGLIAFTPFAASAPGDLLPVGPSPTGDGQGACFVRAWTWALPSRPSGPEPLAVELARWLADPEFSGPWTRALGLLPAGATALGTWPEDDLTSLAGLLATRCAPLPTPDDLARFGPILRQAAEAALTGELTPEAAASRAVLALPRP